MGRVITKGNRMVLSPQAKILGNLVAGVLPSDAVNKAQLDALQQGTVDVTRIELASDGTAAAPAITWNGDSDTGFYRISANKIGFSSNGTLNVTLGQIDGTAGLEVAGFIRSSTILAAGQSGDAAVVDIYPSTAAKGKIQIAAADSAGDTTTTITNASQAGARTYTIPDAGGNANFVLTTSIGAVLGARCTTQTDYTSNTTLGNVTGLSVSVLAAGVYGFRAYIAGTATVNGGLKLAIGGTATATSISYTGANKNAATINASTTVTTLGNAVAGATAVFTDGWIEGTIVVNAAGTLTVQAAQNASHVDTSSVFVNSYFLVTRIA